MYMCIGSGISTLNKMIASQGDDCVLAKSQDLSEARWIENASKFIAASKISLENTEIQPGILFIKMDATIKIKQLPDSQ